MFPKALLTFVLACLAVVDASPLSRSTGKATLSFTTRFNGFDTVNVAEMDRARAQAFKNAGHSSKHDTTISVANSGVTYTAEVSVGTPPTSYSLVIDTGSSNTWIGANVPYAQTSTSQDTGNTVSVSYGSGSFSGEEYTDTVMFGPGLVIQEQSIGVASTSTGFSGVDGILGIGPVDLTSDTVSNTDTVPTVTDNLLSQGTIFQEVIGIYYIPASESSSTGELTFGGVDEFVITSGVKYTSLTTTVPVSQFWGINQSISYGGTTILPETSGIVDTGTTLILIATDAFQKYKSTTGGTEDQTTGLLRVTSDQYANLKPLSFNIGGTSYNLLPNAQIWPRSLNTAIGGSSGSIYLVVNDLGSPSGGGLDFINGYAFLERYYSVYDTTNGRVGFATTRHTDSNAN